MARLEDSTLCDHPFGIERRLARVDSIGDEWEAHACRWTGLDQPKPEVPIGQMPKAAVEAAHIPEQVRADNYVRAARWHEVSFGETLHKVFGRGGRFTSQEQAASIDLDHAGIRPSPASLLGGGKLPPELLWAPQIVVVEERDPGSNCRLSANVAGSCHSDRQLVSEDVNSMIVQQPDGLRRSIRGTIIYDQNLEVERLLSEHGTDGAEQQLASVVRRNDDRDSRGHLFINLCDQIKRRYISSFAQRSTLHGADGHD